MQFEALCQVDPDAARRDAFRAAVQGGPWRLATFEALLARVPTPFAAVLVHDAGDALANVLERLASARRTLAVIAYQETIAPAAVVDALHAGAVDYLAWPLDAESLPDRLQLAAHRADRSMRAAARVRDAQERVAGLSERERAVLLHLGAGASNKHIAKELGISHRTVEIHRANMIGKLGVSGSAEAVAVAIRADLVSDAPD